MPSSKNLAKKFCIRRIEDTIKTKLLQLTFEWNMHAMKIPSSYFLVLVVQNPKVQQKHNANLIIMF